MRVVQWERHSSDSPLLNHRHVQPIQRSQKIRKEIPDWLCMLTDRKHVAREFTGACTMVGMLYYTHPSGRGYVAYW